MDCPSEENLIRMKLSGLEDIRHLHFNLEARKLEVVHRSDPARLLKMLEELKMGARLEKSEQTEEGSLHPEKDQRKVLWIVLGINFAFFVIEMTTGWISGSMGLVADSLDMLADAFVYGLSLFAVGGSLQRKKSIASVAGYFQLSLAILGFAEVLRRFFGEGPLPDFRTMILISLLALMANAICLILLQKAKGKEEAHIRASLIFTANDIIINLGVIVAALGVWWMQSGWPDLLAGAAVFILVVRGAFRILRLGK